MPFVKVPIPFDSKANFWLHNPLVKHILPFSVVYKLDEGKQKSSDFMWSVVFMCDPDEDVNIFFRYDKDNRKQHIKNMFPNADLDTQLFEECIQVYPFECMDSIKRSLYDLKNSLVSRATFLREIDYNIENGKDLDIMHKNTKALYKDLQSTIEEFSAAKSADLRIKGGRKESLSERNEL